MRLRYLKGEGISAQFTGDFITVYFGDPKKSPEYTARFKPEADIPDEYAERLLSNPAYRGMFTKVDAPQEQKSEFLCDKCGFSAKSMAALGSHKRIHKEK